MPMQKVEQMANTVINAVGNPGTAGTPVPANTQVL